MSLIAVLRPFRIGLFLTGLNPMRHDRAADRLRISRWRQLYTVSLAVVLLPIMCISFRDAAAALFDRGGCVQTNVLVQVVQVGLLMADYAMVLVFGQWAPQRKCDFINAMHANTARSGALLRCVGRQMRAEAVGLNLFQLGLLVLLEWLESHGVLVLSAVFVGLVLTVNIEILYMRTLVKVLIGRFRVARRRMAVLLAPDAAGPDDGGCRALALAVQMDKLDGLFELKSQYQGIVGTFLGFHLTAELLSVTMMLYVAWYSLVYVGGVGVFVVVAVCLCARIAPVWLKFVMLVAPFEQMAGEIDAIRVIAANACTDDQQQLRLSLDLLLINLQHFEATKYITANGFFSINYTMLFSMAAAIMTHMLVLLQFQQWEDNNMSSSPIDASQQNATFLATG